MAGCRLDNVLGCCSGVVELAAGCARVAVARWLQAAEKAAPKLRKHVVSTSTGLACIWIEWHVLWWQTLCFVLEDSAQAKAASEDQGTLFLLNLQYPKRSTCNTPLVFHRNCCGTLQYVVRPCRFWAWSGCFCCTGCRWAVDYEGRATLEEQLWDLRMTYAREGAHTPWSRRTKKWKRRDTMYCIDKMGMYKRARERNQVFEQSPSLPYLKAWNVVASLLEFECFPQATEATSKEGEQTWDAYVEAETPRWRMIQSV